MSYFNGGIQLHICMEKMKIWKTIGRRGLRQKFTGMILNYSWLKYVDIFWDMVGGQLTRNDTLILGGDNNQQTWTQSFGLLNVNLIVLLTTLSSKAIHQSIYPSKNSTYSINPPLLLLITDYIYHLRCRLTKRLYT